MPTRLVHLAFDANDVGAQARFWAAALGWEIVHEEADEAAVAPAGFEYLGPGAVPLIFVPVPERKTVRNRVHLDLASSSPEHQAELAGRLTSLGASPADIGQHDVPWVVMADPEGNELCVLEPRDRYRDTGPVAAILTDCRDPAAQAVFWSRVTGWPVSYQVEDVIVGLRSPAGGGPFLEFLRNPGQKTVKNRLHPDLAPEKSDDRAAELDRLLAAGAHRAGIGQGEVPWAVLADPEGNEFCLLSSR
jgi:catechol 2,3-dioxygenase-like lactoylglutathione lyase family enzyme